MVLSLITMAGVTLASSEFIAGTLAGLGAVATISSATKSVR